MSEKILNLEVNSDVLEEYLMKTIENQVNKIELNKVFYTFNDLVQITGFSEGHIRNTFFDDERFIKIRHRIGRKWVFPVEETDAFLKMWIKEQPNM